MSKNSRNGSEGLNSLIFFTPYNERVIESLETASYMEDDEKHVMADTVGVGDITLLYFFKIMYGQKEDVWNG